VARSRSWSTVSGSGSVERRETFEAPVEPGRHTLQVRTGRFSSRTKAFDAAEAETFRFQCHGGRLWPVLLGSLVVPSLALKLNHE
jgi:hypothetical protein